MKKLNELKNKIGIKGPVVLVVMDGVGIGPDYEGNAVKRAYTPTLDMLWDKYPHISLKAHGTAVGLPSDDDMGNSEVGHNALGSGQVFSQGAKLVNESIASEKLFLGETWRLLSGSCRDNGTAMHFIGLFSDGNVHSHIDHLKAMIEHAKKDGVKRVFVHILLDGRDVGETSALDYVRPFESFLSSVSTDGFSAEIASGGGRMKITMDRYEANWKMVEDGWHTHVLGEGRMFPSAEEAITAYRNELGVIDQDLPAFVISKDGKTPLATINDGDSVIFYNFRGDRAIEISKAFEGGNDFNKFDRVRVPKVFYAGMLEYDGDAHVPSRYLVSPPEIRNTLGEYLAGTGVKQFAISETQKYGHVTYFWNGNRTGKFDDGTETYEEIPSDIVPFEQRPWMQCALICDRLIEVLESGKYDFIRANFPNGDMVGHTGSLEATICSMEALDLQIGRLLKAVDAAGGVLILTADHGNSDEMYETDKKGNVKYGPDGTPKAKTSHTLNPVPCFIYDNGASGRYAVSREGGYGLSNLASTVALFLGYEPAPMWNRAIIDIK
ncbi:MAG: 2,3-bisphosphoglycerate-independent phosphoglycerate mutase [Clostridia bacterium]|nr:2,3-bisphosphoglycerate-independent phosphoglycerate mutase [Clostridia bacterium]